MQLDHKQSAANATKARADFNEFLNHAAKRGALDIEHVRVKTRQPSTEAFSRKAVMAVHKLANGTNVKMTNADRRVSAATPAGVVAHAEAVTLFMAADKHLSRYLGEPAEATPSGVPGWTANADLFVLLQAYSFHEASRRQSANPAFSAGAFAVASGGGQALAKNIAGAADSVFVQSFADVHAIALRAAFDGAAVALETMDEVLAAREAGADFGVFSLAPLSHDTLFAMQVLRAQLQLGHEFSSMSREALWQNSRWAATEGIAAWLQRHGVSYREATGLAANLERVDDLVTAASGPTRTTSQTTA
jgi:hypothetical protein